jgi:hypothetical protein
VGPTRAWNLQGKEVVTDNDRCAFWAPTTNGICAFVDTDDKYSCKVRNTIHDGGRPFSLPNITKFCVKFEASGCVYRFVRSGVVDVIGKTGFTAQDCVESDPLIFDPLEWRLLPGLPARPDGKPYGADVDRIISSRKQ